MLRDLSGVVAEIVVKHKAQTTFVQQLLIGPVKIMRGKPGTDITLTVVREGADKPLEFTVTRDIIKVKSVKSRMLDPGFGYVRISNFQSKTARDLLDAINKLKEENEDELHGLVLDLRQATEQLNRLSTRLREEPSRLIYQPRQDPVVVDP